MKILISDDHPKRYNILLKELECLGIDRTNVFFAESADSTQDYLENKSFDLLILDILLPAYDYEEDVSHNNSLSILTLICDDDTVIRPSKVIGITSDEAAAGAASQLFHENTWSIINYSPTDTEWVRQIINCVKYIKQVIEGDSNSLPIKSHVDLLIVCALETPEFDAVLNLPWNWEASRPIDNLIFVRDGWFYSKGKKITVVATFSSRMGMVSSALKSYAIISKLNPKVVTMTGICAGVKEKVSIGDVLFADPAWDYQSGKRVKDSGTNKFSIAPHQLPADYSIRTHIEQIRSNKEFFTNLPSQFSADCDFTTSLKIGPVASGSAVLADGDSIEEIKTQQRDLIGVEMEIYGIYAAAAASSPPPKFFALKGVCDYADPDKIDIAQDYAAYASAKVLQKLFEDYGNRLVGDVNGR